MELEGRVTLVTGAGAGIGRAIARRLGREGCVVVVADLDAQAGERTAAELGRAVFVPIDVAREADLRRLFHLIEARFGGLDILVNNAGGVPAPHYPRAPLEQWTRVLQVNLWAVLRTIQLALEPMGARGGGAVVNIGSMGGVGFRPYDAPEYGAAKAGVIRLTASLGWLKEEANIRVNCIAPGWVETEAVAEGLARMPDAERRRAGVPTRLIQLEEIAGLVVRLIQDQSLAGRVVIWPDEQPWQIVPVEAAT